MHTPPVVPPSSPLAAVGSERTWSVGTLTYNRSQLITVFFWLLWGDFVLTLMDNGVVGNVVQLQLKGWGASNATVGFLSGTVTALLSAVGVAAISTASDRHRGPRGRRIPFMFWATPPLALCLAAVGFSPQIASAIEQLSPGLARAFGNLAASVLPGVSGLPPATHLILAVFTTTLTLYRVADLFPQTVYYYLWADVVPAKMIGMFACCFRIVAAIGMFVFNQFLLGKAATDPEWLYAGAAGLYLVSFIAMCLRVKEGEYPPPPAPDAAPGLGAGGPVARALNYIRESYSNAFYWKFFLMSGAFIIAVRALRRRK